MLKTMLSEWTKLKTTRSFWVTSALAVFFGLGWVLLIASLDSAETPMYSAALVPAGFISFGLMVIVIQAIMVVTTEYRYKVSATNFTLTPSRWQVALAKLVVYGAFSAALAFVTIVLAFVLGDLVSSSPIEWASNEFARRSLWAIPLGTFTSVLFAQGLGWIIKQTAGAISIYLGWQLVLEPALAIIPKVGMKIQAYAPFTNLNYFLANLENPGPDPMGGGQPLEMWHTYVLFAVWAVVLYGVGVLLLEKRDA